MLAALRAGKHVFCEKPLCLTLAELAEVEAEALARPKQQLMVGFNRRFSPLVVKMKSLLEAIDVPKNLVITVNAGEIPADHWTQDPNVGGGRIIGEGCHFIDLIRFLVDAEITSFNALALGEHPAVSTNNDKVSILLGFSDGSVGVVNYLANGHKAVAKERLEVFAGGRVLQLDNFLTLKGYGWDKFKKKRLWSQDKGNEACAAAFITAVKAGALPVIPLSEVLEVSRVAMEIESSLR